MSLPQLLHLATASLQLDAWECSASRHIRGDTPTTSSCDLLGAPGWLNQQRGCLLRCGWSTLQLLERGSARRVGAKVDAWYEGGWWLAEVLPDAAEDGYVVVGDAAGNTRSVPLDELRTSLTWRDGRWSAVRTKGVVLGCAE